MNFITFSAASTNLFPAANSTNGSQLVTEWNMKSRESVGTDPNVVYTIGPSFVHSSKDFEVKVLQDAGGAIINNYTLSIQPGRGVINGHFVETLNPMTIDLIEANAQLISQSRPVLKGSLAIGIRTFFSTDQTVAGSILVENEDDMFLGIQLVVLPEEELITPSDSPDDPAKVTADILLAKFTFVNNAISAIINSPTKIQYIPSDRVTSISEVVSDKYVTKIGLNSKKIYAFAGKGVDPETGKDTWEDVTDSMMIWDSTPQRTTDVPEYTQADIYTKDEKGYLVVPHKQVTGMTTDDGNPEYYLPRVIEIPSADYIEGTTGFVNKSYTDQIKDISRRVNQFRTSLTGKQIMYMDVRAYDDELPPINDRWEEGDYILVGIDEYYTGGEADLARSPSTMYVVLPGLVKDILFVDSLEGDASDEPGVPENIRGVQLGFQEWYESAGQQRPDTEHPEYYPIFFTEAAPPRGKQYVRSSNIWYDYFRIRYYLEENPEDPDYPKYPFIDYFYGVYESYPKAWSDAVLVTGSIPFATEDDIGGFFNVSTNQTDYGYVYLDDTGHLKLVDYALLRSGTLAYQIGQNVTIPESESYTAIQSSIDEFINNRVAFPTSETHGKYCSLLHIYLTLPATTENVTLEISGIDSRFNTAVCLHIAGQATSNVAINIMDCQKIMIDPTIEGSPTINIFRSCLYYDPSVFEYIRNCTRDVNLYGQFTGFQDLTIWYEQTAEGDAPLVVDGMTVSELDSPIITSEIDYWKELGTVINDNNYLVALKNITFSGTGDIVACEVLVANNSTDNIDPGDKIVVGECVLPQGEYLIYPISCLTRVLKVSGTFTSAYYSDSNWYVTDNAFTLETGVYNPTDTSQSMKGTIAFHSVTTLVPSTIEQTSISGWEPDSYHVFRGGAIT